MKVAGLIMLVHGNMAIAAHLIHRAQQDANILSCYPLRQAEPITATITEEGFDPVEFFGGWFEKLNPLGP